MTQRRIGKKIFLLLLTGVLLLQIPAVAAQSGTAFSDVSADAWYAKYVDMCTQYGIIGGKGDTNGDGAAEFDPDGTLTNGEFVKLVATACEALELLPITGTNVSIHWAQPYWEALNEAYALSGTKIYCTAASLDKPINRYEMAQLLENALYKITYENDVNFPNASKVIKDYGSLPENYRSSVVQVYGKGIVSGYDGGNFQGTDLLTRAQAAKIIYLTLWANDRAKLSGVSEQTAHTSTTPKAKEWQQLHYINAYGGITAELKQILFGSTSKSHFSSANEAKNYMKTVTIPVWKINSKGVKYSTTTTVTVNKVLADDVLGIFTQIYNDPERFPIESAGGARYTDTMRHSWGCAIDINPAQNAECRAYYNADGSVKSVKQTCGSGWWPLNSSKTAFAGSLTASSAYSIGKGSSVVKAFKDYGWGWAGNGYSIRSSDNSQKFDYMHFSILPNGG